MVTTFIIGTPAAVPVPVVCAAAAESSRCHVEKSSIPRESRSCKMMSGLRTGDHGGNCDPIAVVLVVVIEGL